MNKITNQEEFTGNLVYENKRVYSYFISEKSMAIVKNDTSLGNSHFN
jgi:hypothetical protein